MSSSRDGNFFLVPSANSTSGEQIFLSPPSSNSPHSDFSLASTVTPLLIPSGDNNRPELMEEKVNLQHLDSPLHLQLKAALSRAETAEENLKMMEKATRHLNHEFRGGLNTVVASALELEELAQQENLEKEREHLEETSMKLIRFVDEFNKVTTQFLDWDKMGHGEMVYSHYALNLTEYLLDLRNESQQIVNNRNENNELPVELEINAKKIDQCKNSLNDIWIMSDRHALNRIFRNFMANAVKFTQTGSIKILVHTLEAKDQAYTLQITIEDTGPGIDPEKVQILFPATPQKTIYHPLADSKNMAVSGSGLGLQIAHSTITDYLKGRVKVQSKLGAGTTIMVESSFAKPTTQQIKEAQESASPTTPPLLRTKARRFQTIMPQMKPNILVVDDELINRKLLNRMINSLGLTCDLAHSGQEALNKYKGSKNAVPYPYRLIFMDIQMELMNGITTTRAIRAQERENKVEDKNKCLIIGLSGSTEEKQNALNAGMTDYLTKPYEKSTIQSVLTQYSLMPKPSSVIPVSLFNPFILSPQPEPQTIQASSKSDTQPSSKKEEETAPQRSFCQRCTIQ